MILENIEVTPIAYDIALPMEATPDKVYVACQIVQDKSRYWRVKRHGELSREKHNYQHQALAEIIEIVDKERMDLLNEAFARDIPIS